MSAVELEGLPFSAEELKAIEWLGDNWWMLLLVAEHFQTAVKSLVPEFYDTDTNDSLGHWWRRIWESLGKVKWLSQEDALQEMREEKTTLQHFVALDIWKALKVYLLKLLEKGEKWEELPSWWSQLQAIYDPPLHEISQLVVWTESTRKMKSK